MIRALVRSIAPIARLIEEQYLEWAAREIHPLHPDVPHIVRRLAELRRPQL